MKIENLIDAVKNNWATEEDWAKFDKLYTEMGKLKRKKQIAAIADDELEKDKINHPLWYKWLKDEIGVEVIDLCELFNFNRGSALKYLLRAGIKTEKGYSVPEKEIEDLEKAKWYIEREIKNLKDMLK